MNGANDLANEFGRNFSTILKWTKEDTFSREFLLLPLHLKEHWSLMVISDAKDVCL
jgi:Ulp1 family protease